MKAPFDNVIQLLDNVCSGKTSVLEFHQKLEPALYMLLSVTLITDNKIREFANRLELILFTEESRKQSTAAAVLASEIKIYLTNLQKGGRG